MKSFRVTGTQFPHLSRETMAHSVIVPHWRPLQSSSRLRRVRVPGKCYQIATPTCWGGSGLLIEVDRPHQTKERSVHLLPEQEGPSGYGWWRLALCLDELESGDWALRIYSFSPGFSYFFFFFKGDGVRKDFMSHRLTSNSSCSWGWPQTSDSSVCTSWGRHWHVPPHQSVKCFWLNSGQHTCQANAPLPEPPPQPTICFTFIRHLLCGWNCMGRDVESN